MLLLSLTFLSSSFAVELGLTKTKKFSVWDVVTDEEKQDDVAVQEEAQRRRRDRSASEDDEDSSSLEQRRDEAVVQERRATAFTDKAFDPDNNSIEELLKRPDEEVLPLLGDARVRNAMLKKVEGYQKEATVEKNTLIPDGSNRNEVVEEATWIWEGLREHMEKALKDDKRPLFLEDIRIAERLRSLVKEKKELTEEMLGFSPESVADFQYDKETLSFKMQEAHALDALSQLRFDAAPALDSMRKKLSAAYEQILSFSRRPTEQQATKLSRGYYSELHESFLTLVGEAVQALGEGRSNAVAALDSLIEKQKTFLFQGRNTDRSEQLLLRAEVEALLLKIKDDAEINAIVDEEMASFPWDFEKAYRENLENLQSAESEGVTPGTGVAGTLSQLNITAKGRAKLEALKTKLKNETGDPLLATRSDSLFLVEFLNEEERNAALENLRKPSKRDAMMRKVFNWSARLVNEVLPFDRWNQAARSEDRDPLLLMLETQKRKIRSANSLLSNDNDLLDALEEAKILYPYVQKKIDLCNNLMGVSPDQWLPYRHKIERLWDENCNRGEGKLALEQLDELAASRLLAEQTMIQRQDPYLRHVLDQIRDEDEQVFTNQASKAVALALKTRQFECRKFSIQVAGGSCLMALCYLLWLGYNNDIAAS